MRKENDTTYTDEELEAAIDRFLASEYNNADYHDNTDNQSNPEHNEEEEENEDYNGQDSNEWGKEGQDSNEWDEEGWDKEEEDPEAEELKEQALCKKDMQEQEAYATKMLTSLNNLTGLRTVKEKLSIYERVVRFNRMRSEKELPSPTLPLHAMFLGSPGTGKTTVAKMIGIMLHRAGILSKGHVVVRERATLLGQNYNSESEKTMEALEKAQGGILFIDEAYQLYQPNDPRDPGRFVIETLLTTLADESHRDWMLIMAGYPEEMKRMLEMNPGFKSRIPESNIYLFEDFTQQELMEIAERYLKRNQYTLTPEAHKALEERLRYDYTHRDNNFGNARHVINMIQTEILPSMAVRVTDGDHPDINALTEIKACDIPAPHKTIQPTHTRIGFI